MTRITRRAGSTKPRACSAVMMALLAFAAGGMVSGCTTNPATGDSMLSLLSPQEEARIGAEQHRKLTPAFGGVISSRDIQHYVASIGQFLAHTSEMPNLRFTFTVLNTDKVNAFALPGGYVYITRGLLALANSEAEVASVLAHEIGHVVARHAAQRYSRSVFLGIGAAALGILTGDGEITRLIGGGLGAHLSSYSREQEFEADMLAVRYLKRAGFKPGAIVSFLKTLTRHSRLSARLMGHPPDQANETNIMSTHPRTVERVRRAAAQAGSTTNLNPIIGRAIYLRKIDGLLYGDAPEQGFVRGRDFLHPELRIRFRVPPGFHLSNRPDRVIAQEPGGSSIVFGSAPRAGNRSPYGYLVNVWGRNLRLEDRKTLTINNMPAATGTARVRSQRGVHDLRLVAIRRGRSMYNFLFLRPPGGGNLDRIYRQTTSSFRGVSRAEARSWRPWRLKIITVRRGDTIARLARRMAVDRLREEHFRVLNGLGARARLVPGRKVKIVILDRRRAS